MAPSTIDDDGNENNDNDDDNSQSSFPCWEYALLPPVASDAGQVEDHRRVGEAAQLLRHGQLVAIPTETVYGLAAHAFDQRAVRTIFQVKNRPADNPLIVHIAGVRMLANYGLVIPPVYRPLVARFWPGPLTILIPKSPPTSAAAQASEASTSPASTAVASAGDRGGGHSVVPWEVSQSAVVAVRMPAHPIARALITVAGVPLAAPSANLSGRPSPTHADHVLHDLRGRIPCIVQDLGGCCESGLESTVVDALQQPPVILRPGGITAEQIRQVPGFEGTRVKTTIASVLSSLSQQSQPQRSVEEEEQEDDLAVPTTPGMKYRHYSPTVTKVVLLRRRRSDGDGSASAATAAATYTAAGVGGSAKKTSTRGGDDFAERVEAEVLALLLQEPEQEQEQEQEQEPEQEPQPEHEQEQEQGADDVCREADALLPRQQPPRGRISFAVVRHGLTLPQLPFQAGACACAGVGVGAYAYAYVAAGSDEYGRKAASSSHLPPLEQDGTAPLPMPDIDLFRVVVPCPSASSPSTSSPSTSSPSTCSPSRHCASASYGERHSPAMMTTTTTTTATTTTTTPTAMMVDYRIHGDAESLGRELFKALRWLDGRVQYLFIEAVPESGHGLAVMNRLSKAAWRELA